MKDLAFWTGYSWMTDRIEECGLIDSLEWMKKNCFDIEYDEGCFLALEIGND